jgi:hypothetical protein
LRDKSNATQGAREKPRLSRARLASCSAARWPQVNAAVPKHQVLHDDALADRIVAGDRQVDLVRGNRRRSGVFDV